MLFQKIKEKF